MMNPYNSARRKPDLSWGKRKIKVIKSFILIMLKLKGVLCYKLKFRDSIVNTVLSSRRIGEIYPLWIWMI